MYIIVDKNPYSEAEVEYWLAPGEGTTTNKREAFKHKTRKSARLHLREYAGSGRIRTRGRFEIIKVDARKR